jgi:hypothetical protein
LSAFDGFPTVGAEFHFPLKDQKNMPNLWKRLAVLNMSQYQQGSYIQFSREDTGVIEIRMNPSVYPVTIANWEHLRLLIPELNDATFWITVNRPREDFSWKGVEKRLPKRLKSISSLRYASQFEEIPEDVSQGEIPFGSAYLGQTVRLNEGNYEFTGLWRGREGTWGQMSLYTGVGDNLPDLAYDLSMALAQPEILNDIPKEVFNQTQTLRGALTMTPDERMEIFNIFESSIQNDVRLQKASEAGSTIIEQLRP